MGAELRAHVQHPRLAGGGQRRSGRGGERLDSHSGADSIKGGGRHALDESLQESAGGHRHAEPICETTALVTQITIGSTIEQPRAVEPKATSTLKSAKLSTYGRLPRPGSPPCTMPIQGALLRHDVHIPSTVYLVIAFRNSHTGTSSPFAASSYSRRQQENVSTYLLTTAGRHAPWRPGLTAQPLRHRLAPCQSRIAGQVAPGSTSSRDPIRPFKLTSIPLLQTEQHGPLRVGHLRRPSFVGQLTMPLGAADARRLQPTGDHRGHICLSAMLCVRGRACYRARLLAGFGADLGR